MSGPTLHSIQVNPAGGVPKGPVPAARLTVGGVAGDRQRNLKVHGGPMRAVCLFSYEGILDLQREGHPIQPGSTGENLTLSGLNWSDVGPGDRLQIGQAVVKITAYTAPCGNIAASFIAGKFQRMDQDRHPGCSRLYAQVLVEGDVRAGDPVIHTKSKE